MNQHKVSDDLKGAVTSNFGRMVFDAVLAIIVAWGTYQAHAIRDELKALHDKDERIQAEAAAFREKVATENVKKEDVRRDLDEIKSILRDIQSQQMARANGRSIGPGVWRDGREANR